MPDQLMIDRIADHAIIELTGSEAADLHARGGDLAATLPPTTLDDADLLTAVEVFGRGLPARLTGELSRFRRYSNDLGTLVIRNVPLDTGLRATPVDGIAPQWHDVPIATVLQLSVSLVLGDIIAYADEKAGLLVQDIMPVPGAETRQENTGSAFLELHTEDGFHPYKPDFLTLLCLRPDHERRAYTITGSVSRVLGRLSDECRAILREPRFVITYASSFGRGGQSRPVAVLGGSPHRPELVADFHAMRGLDGPADWALDELRDAMVGILVGTVLEGGDLLIVDNRAAVHGRTGFVPRYDGRDRWLRRCFAVADLRRSRGHRADGSQVCLPLSVIRPE